MSGDSKIIEISPAISDQNAAIINSSTTIQIVEREKDFSEVTFNKNSLTNISLTSYLYDKFQTTGHYEPIFEYGESNNPINVFKARIKINYNFLIREFERYLRERTENEIPEFYRILVNKILEEENFKKFAGQSFFDVPDQNFKEGMFDTDREKIFPFKFQQEIEDKLGFSSFSSFLDKFNSFKEQLPFYTEIALDSHNFSRQGTFLEILEKYNFFNELISNVLTTDTEANNKVLITSRQERLNSEAEASIKQLELTQDFFKTLASVEDEQKFRMASMLNKLVKNNKTSFEDTLRGSPCYSEVIGYKISKFDINSPNPTPLDVWYVPNINKQTIEIIDSKIKYGKEYTYKVSLIVFVIASKITYTELVATTATSAATTPTQTNPGTSTASPNPAGQGAVLGFAVPIATGIVIEPSTVVVQNDLILPVRLMQEFIESYDDLVLNLVYEKISEITSALDLIKANLFNFERTGIDNNLLEPIIQKTKEILTDLDSKEAYRVKFIEFLTLYSAYLQYITNKSTNAQAASSPNVTATTATLTGLEAINFLQNQTILGQLSPSTNISVNFGSDIINNNILNNTNTPSVVTTETLKFINEPVLKIFEIDSTEYSNILLDAPPIEPEIEILPFIGNDKNIKINLFTGIGTKDVIPVSFSGEETRIYDSFKIAQEKISPENKKITFSSDEISDYFIIYRLEQAPKSYQDFNDAATIEVDKDFGSSAGSFIDNIKPNTKYYYTFRSVDYHGNISLPTPVYEVRILNENGVIIPEINLYEPKIENITEVSKPFKRFLYIAPAYRQKVLNQTENSLAQYGNPELIKRNVSLGTGTDGVWDRKFKIRLNSKSTGRSIDINIIFSINKD